MTREQLAHILRSAARITDDPGILVIGSQAILGSYSEADLPPDAWLSIEADVAFLSDPDGKKADAVDGAIGEESEFHAAFDVYGQGVEVAVAVLPQGWQSRLVPFDMQSALSAKAVCLERHDLVVSKLAAGREKDIAFALALIDADLVDVPTLYDRAQLLSDEHHVYSFRVSQWLRQEGARRDIALPANL